MKQRTLAMMTGFEQNTRKTRRALFLEEMEQVVPWRKVCAGGAALSQAWERAATGGSRTDVADLFFAAVVQPVGPGGDAAVRGY